MAFVIITVICNSPVTIVEVTKFALVHFFNKETHESDLVKSFDKIHDWVFIPIQYSTALWLSLLILSDPFTYLIFKKRVRCTTKKQR